MPSDSKLSAPAVLVRRTRGEGTIEEPVSQHGLALRIETESGGTVTYNLRWSAAGELQVRSLASELAIRPEAANTVLIQADHDDDGAPLR